MTSLKIHGIFVTTFFALLLISFYFSIFFIHICLSHNFPPIMTKEKQLFYCTRFSESSCKNVLWLIPHEIFFKILKKWISFLLNSMKYSDHFLIWFSKILHFSSLLHRGWTIDLDKITVSGLLILHLFSFKKHILTTKKIYHFSSWWTKQLTLILLLHNPVVSVDFLLAYLKQANKGI